MCANPKATAEALLAAGEPDVENLLTIIGVANTPDGIAAINAYKAAEVAVADWTPGSTAADVTQVVNAFTHVFNTLPIPEDAKLLENAISALIVGVLGVISANSQAPAEQPAETPEISANVQTIHAHAVAADTEAKVTALTGYKPSVITKAKVMLGDHGAIAGQWKTQWKKAVEASDPKYASLAA